jgi:hypothetical protein
MATHLFALANMNLPPISGLDIRPPTGAEMARATYLFRGTRPPPQAQFLVAVRSQPVERFVAAAAWWYAGKIACFQLASQPGIDRAETCASLIHAVAERVRAAGMETIQYGESLAEGSEWIGFLQNQGFTWLRSERFFELAVAPAWKRSMETYEKYQARIPATWQMEAIRGHTPEIIFDLIAPFRLMPPAELRSYWRPDAVAGFDLDMSSILFDGKRPFGTLLARRAPDSLYIDIRVVTHENQLLRALGNMLLLWHMARQREQNQRIQWLKFRGGAAEHPETANLARRMEGREMPPRHIYSRTL